MASRRRPVSWRGCCARVLKGGRGLISAYGSFRFVRVQNMMFLTIIRREVFMLLSYDSYDRSKVDVWIVSYEVRNILSISLVKT